MRCWIAGPDAIPADSAGSRRAVGWPLAGFGPGPCQEIRSLFSVFPQPVNSCLVKTGLCHRPLYFQRR